MHRLAALLAVAAIGAQAQEAGTPAAEAAPASAVDPAPGSKEWYDARMAAIGAEQKALDDAAAAQAKKPGARIGMTAKQVRDTTSWGTPESVNTTITAGHKREQWVYDGNQYLYFDNGRLTAIQGH